MNVNSSYFSTPNEFKIVIVGVQGQTGGYADFFAGQGVISYYGGTGLYYPGNCPNNEGDVTTETSNMQCDSLNWDSSKSRTQIYNALPPALTLSASSDSPTIGQSVQLTANVNQALDNASKLTVRKDDLTTNEVIQTCGVVRRLGLS